MQERAGKKKRKAVLYGVAVAKDDKDEYPELPVGQGKKAASKGKLASSVPS